MSPNSFNAKVFKGSPNGRILEGVQSYDLKENDVLIHIEYCGLCYTDVHYKAQDMVLGHEGVGKIEAVGSGVNDFKKGDRVGWGYVHNTCKKCPQCLSGQEIYCPKSVMYGTHDHEKGGFSTLCPISSEYVFRIPDSLPLKYAAPLMCGGATVFTPLWEHTKPTDHVGILGIGGLGHLAIQFAAKMGCEVTVFSSTDSKKEEAMQLGASRFISSSDNKKMDLGEGVRPLDCLLICSSKVPDLTPYFPILAPRASIIPLSVTGPEEQISYPHMTFMSAGLRAVGAIIAPRFIHNLMLNFAARHKVYPVIEEFPMTVEGIEEGFQKLQSGKVRYRAVMKNVE